MAVLLDVESGVARITLNRPEVYNAIDLATARAFSAAVREVAADGGVRAVVLRGAGRAFCAGGDVRAMAAAPDTAGFVHELATAFHEGFALLVELPCPVVAAVHGLAAGAGLGLALAADLAVAEESARLTAAYGAIGVSPDSGVSYLLPRAVGPARAFRLTLAGGELTAGEALTWGLIAEVAPDGAAGTRAEDLAHRLAATPTPAVRQTKRLLRAAATRDLRSHLADEARTIARTAASPEAIQRITAFARTGKRTATATPPDGPRHAPEPRHAVAEAPSPDPPVAGTHEPPAAKPAPPGSPAAMENDPEEPPCPSSA